VFDQHGQRKYLNAKERKRFLAVVSAIPERSQRTFCQTLYYTGCRPGEALGLTVDRIDIQEHSLVFATLKQRGAIRYRSVPVPADLIDDLRALTTGRSSSQTVWPLSRSSGWRLVKKCLIQAGVSGPRATSRGLRHGFAVACIQKNIPLSTVQKWLGHRSLKNTSIYLDFTAADERTFARRIW